MDNLLTVTEVAKDWRVSPKTVINWIHKGWIEAIRTPGGQWRISEEELQRLKEELEE